MEDLALSKDELAKLPKDTLRLLLGVKQKKPGSAKKAQLVQLLIAKPKKVPALAKKPVGKRPKPAGKGGPGPANARRLGKSAAAKWPSGRLQLAIRKPVQGKGSRPKAQKPVPPPLPPLPKLGDFSRVPGVCLSQIAAMASVRDRVLTLLPVCREFKRAMADPLAWSPTVLGADDQLALKLGKALRDRSWHACNWWLLKTLHQAREVRLNLWKARYMYAGIDNESDSEDEAAALRDKRAKRLEVAQENVKYNARSSLFDHFLRLPGVRKIRLSGLDASQTQQARRQYRHFGHFRVAWQPEDATYTIEAEDRAPEPLDLPALAALNTARATQCRMETITLNNFWPRRTVENWTIKPDPELHLAEALMLRDFPVLVKVWSAERGLPSAKPKAVFHYTCGELPPITKKAARALYDEVLKTLSAKYPAWRATALGGAKPLWTFVKGQTK